MAPRPARKSRSADALKRNDKDPHIIAAVAMLFWNDRKVDKSRAWFERWGKGVEAWVEGQRVEGGAEGEVAAWFEK